MPLTTPGMGSRYLKNKFIWLIALIGTQSIVKHATLGPLAMRTISYAFLQTHGLPNNIKIKKVGSFALTFSLMEEEKVLVKLHAFIVLKNMKMKGFLV